MTPSRNSPQALFQEGWDKHYSGMVEWYGPDVHGGLKSIDVAASKVETDLDTFEGALLNIIPAQKAGAIAIAAGVADDKGFCPIDPSSMRSTMDEAILVIGDASNLRALFPILVIAIVGLATYDGLLVPLRDSVSGIVATTAIGGNDLLEHLGTGHGAGMDAGALVLAAGIAIAARSGASLWRLLGGLAIGATVVAGW